MKKKPLFYGLFTLAAVLLSLVIQLPAKQVYPRLAEKYPLALKLYQLNGSIWHGRASLVLIKGRRLKDIQWQFHPLALLLGRLEGRIEAHKGDAGVLRTVVGRALNGDLYLRRLSLHIPLADADALINNSPLGLSGHLQVDLQHLEIANRRLTTAKGLIRIDDAGLGAPLNTRIGSFSLRLSDTAEGIKGVLGDQGGPLQLNGLLQIKRDGRYKLTATLTLRDTNRTDLQRALRYFGTPGPDGKLSIVRSGKIDLTTLAGML